MPHRASSTTMSRGVRPLLRAILAFNCLLLSGRAGAEGCGPVTAGPPASCTASAPASIGSDAPGAGAGNPINVITGNKYQREEDMPALPGVLGLEIVRHYNSAYSKPGMPNGLMGRGWKLSYETELFDKFGRIQILQADGARIIFERDREHPNLCSTRLPANGHLTLTPNAQGILSYVWTWPNGRRLIFNAAGKLDRITAPTGETVRLTYDTINVLIRVEDPQGRSLTLGYDDQRQERFRGVHTIDSPVGRFVYEYGSAVPQGSQPFDARILLANLVRVQLPTHYEPYRPAHPLTSRGATTSGASRIYHHEDPRFPWLLTGISMETTESNKPVATRVATYGYDSNGLANLSTHAQDAGKVTLTYPGGGKTVLTNSLGQQTIYRHAIISGEFRLLEVRGAGCASCGEANVRYGYDKLGLWVETTRLDARGNPVDGIRRELDSLGRPARIGKVGYQHGQPGPVQWLVRYEYAGDHHVPTLIVRPSVAPGKEGQTRIAYNAAGQPVSVTETGWVPSYDGKRAVASIARTTSYGYATINGHSVLTRIDGPLPNGPANSPHDSDVTLFEYDRRPDSESIALSSPGKLARYDEREQGIGLLTRIIAPGNITTEVLERDQAMRPAKLRTTDGDQVRLTTLHYHWRGAPADIELAAGALRRHLHYDFDADGRISAVTRPGNLRSSIEYDQAGRPSRIILPDGSGLALQHDSEHHLTGMARHRDMDGMAPASALSSLRFDYSQVADQPGRLSQVSDTLGLLARYRYNDAGQVIAFANALGATTTFDYDADGRVSRRTAAAHSDDAAMLGLSYDQSGHATAIRAPNDATTLRRYDDFGRKVFEADPDRGVTLFQYDAASRPLVRIDETGSATRFMYDHAGRLLAVGKDKVSDLLQYRYRGSKLVNLLSTPDGKPEHATEKVAYQYDALGQQTQESRWLAEPGRTGAGATGRLFVTGYEYDQAGRLVRLVLPDGHSLRYRFAPADDTAYQKVDPRHRPGQLEAILFDDQAVVTDIEQTIAGGLTGYTMANGARQQITLDRRGRIEQLRTLAGDAAAQSNWRSSVTGWFSPAPNNATPYHQSNHFDEAGRLVETERTLAATGTALPPTRREHYAYDHLDRLTGITASDASSTQFRYDRGGNRIAESSTPAQAAGPETALHTGGQSERRYHYARAGNWLLAATQTASDGESLALRSAWLHHPTGVPLARLQWNADRAASRRIVYSSDKRPVAVYDNARLVARYHYNSLGERIAKTVYPVKPALIPVAVPGATPHGETSYALYRDQRLAAETDSLGRITGHYVYLYGKPVAKIEMRDNTNFLHQLWKTITLRTADDASDRLAQVYPIVTDHLGTPQQVLDQRQHVVWQAVTAPFGQARVIHTAAGNNGQPFQMNLRLPGQVFDAETGLHYNYLRDYDPALGRYLAPDPVRQAGENPYAYVSNNPLTNIDPLGLFQSDIHYYMTFFLGLAAGVNPEEARIIALAAQYVDDNPDTKPLNVSPLTINEHRVRLLTYHFTMVPSSVDPDTGLLIGSLSSYDDPPRNPAYANIPENAQLGRLYAAVTTAGNAINLSNAHCTQLQFLGEYLHAFEDTFAHRDSNDMPFPLNVGLGHAGYGSNPDYTYNHTSLIPLPGALNWDTNEARTLQAEKEVFAKLAAWGDAGKAKSFADIEKTLRAFNAIHENEGTGDTTEEKQKGYTDKINLLQSTLKVLDYTGIDITKTDRHGFDTVQATDNRKKHLQDKDGKPLDQKLYNGTILPK